MEYMNVIDCGAGDAEEVMAEPKFELCVWDASDSTHELFGELELQGGGYTWQGVLESLVRRFFSGAVTEAGTS